MRLVSGNRNGGVLVFCAIGLVVLLSMAGLVVDGGNLFLIRQRLQSAVDAAALAAAQRLPDSATATSAATLAFNLNAPGGALHSITTNVSGTNQYQVVAVVKYAPSLLSALGVREFSIGARAVAENRPASGGGASSKYDPFTTNGPFARGLFSRRAPTISNSVTIQSWAFGVGNTSTGANLFTDEAITMANSSKVTGSVRTPGNLTLQNSAEIFNDAMVGGNTLMQNSAKIHDDLFTNGTATFENSAQVLGTSTPNAGQSIPLGATDLLKPINFTPAAASNNNASIPAGFKNGSSPPGITLTNSQTLTLAAGTYYFSSLDLGNSSTINLSGPVQIYLTGPMTLQNSSKFSNTNPSQLMVYTNNSATFQNSSVFYGGLYAPNGTIATQNSVQMYGGFIADRVTMSNSVAFNIDDNLVANMDVAAGTGNLAGAPTNPAHFGLVE